MPNKCFHGLKIIVIAFLHSYSAIIQRLPEIIEGGGGAVAPVRGRGSPYTGCIKKKVIELQRAIIRELLGV